MKASNVNPICLKWWDPVQGLPQGSYFYINYTPQIQIDIVDGCYIFMALETSDNVWVSKKYFFEYQVIELQRRISGQKTGLHAG